MLHRAARNAYSWWWASHIRTKQSKWLDQNLQDMEEKVEYILKIIEEDGDSFAQRAEMYYRKRPELVNFVEDSFRGYRALAERYDHLSRELQSANRTIATVYPEQVQLAMDEEEEEEIFPTTTTTPFSDPQQASKNLPAVPKLNIPKNPKIPRKSSKTAPARLMSKKGLIKMSGPTVTEDAAPSSGMSKVEALEEIDRLQKRILGLQTEKEFVKSSYESGLAKYWEIEDQVTEMQAKVNLLQDESGIGTFIEDDEARTLMAATALKSCQEALVRLHEKQKVSDEQAGIEYQRIKESHEKLKVLKGNFANQTSGNGDLIENLELVGSSMVVNDLDQQVESMEKQRNDLEMLREKIQEELQVDSSASSLTMSELAEKIDDLVEKVITLGTAVSSQNALVKRLRSETDELQGQLRSLEGDKEALIEGSDSKSNKIRELEQELVRIQNLNQNVKTQNRNLHIHFTQASFSVDHLSEKLQTVKQEDEDEVEHVVTFKDMRAAVPCVDEGTASQNNSLKMSKDVKSQGKEKSDVMEERGSTSSHVDEFLVPVEVRDVLPNANLERSFNRNEDAMDFGYESEILKNVRMEEEVKKDDICIKDEESLGQPELSDYLDDLSVKGQVVSVAADDNRVEGLNELKEMMDPRHDEVIAKHVKAEEREKENDSPHDHHPVRAEDENSFEFNPRMMDPRHSEVITQDVKTEEKEKEKDSPLDHHPVRAEEKNLFEFNPGDSPKLLLSGQVRAMMDPRHDEVITEDVKTEEKEKENDSPPDRHPVRIDSFVFNPRDSPQLEDLSGHVRADLGTDSKGLKDHEGKMTSANDSVISTDEQTEKGEKEFSFPDLRAFVKAEEETIFHSNPSSPFDDFPRKDQVRVAQDDSLLGEYEMQGGPKANTEKGFEEHENIVNDPLTSKDANAEKEEMKGDVHNCMAQDDSLLGEYKVQGGPKANPQKEFEELEYMLVVPDNDPLISKDANAEKEEMKDDVHNCITSLKTNDEENNCIQSNASNHFDNEEPKNEENHSVGSQEMETTENEDQLNWQQLFSNKLDDREKIMLQRYTSILRNYKETKKKLGEMEKKNNDSLFKTKVQIKELKNANALKDAEIQSLHKKLNLCFDENPEGEKMVISDQNQVSDLLDEQKVESTASPRKGEEGEKRVVSDQYQVTDLVNEQKVESIASPIKGEGEKRVILANEPHLVSSMVEEKFRSDIDGLLEENIEFWLRFSTSFHQIQKFATSVHDLQEEFTKLRENRKQEGNSTKHHQPLNSSDLRPIYKHLSEIQTELALWLEHNSLLEEDLQNRLSSLSSMHEEILRLSNVEREAGDDHLSDYQAAKFQGEVLNMKQENNKVGYKLQEGLERVRELRNEITKTLENLEEELGMKERRSKNSSSRSRIPLRSFLFGVRLRKQKPSSLFQCMSPALQKQYSDLNSLKTT